MFASLPMYDFPELRPHTAALWRAIRARVAGLEAEVPLAPSGSDHAAEWRDPGLLFGQTCGWPLVKSLGRTVVTVATPQYAAAGCDGPRHRSLLVVPAAAPWTRLDDLRGRRLALNGWDSNSGMNLLRARVAPLARDGRFFGAVTVTGAHSASLAAVGDGAADLAAIDCVSFALLGRLRPELTARVRVIGTTPSAPALPFVMARGLARRWLAPVRAALNAALADPALAETRAALGLAGVSVLERRRYARISALARAAARRGYPALA